MAAAPTAIRRPISRVRSVTETSMMFMMPTPPTTREMAATTSNSALTSPVARAIISGDLAHVADFEVVATVGRKAVALAEQAGDLLDGLGDLIARRPPWP